MKLLFFCPGWHHSYLSISLGSFRCVGISIPQEAWFGHLFGWQLGFWVPCICLLLKCGLGVYFRSEIWQACFEQLEFHQLNWINAERCIFQPANGCWAYHSLVKVLFLHCLWLRKIMWKRKKHEKTFYSLMLVDS